MIDTKGIWSGLTASIAWGMTGIFVRYLPGLSPVVVTSGRLLVALAASIPLLVAVRRYRHSFVASLLDPAAWWLSIAFVVYYTTAVAAYQLAPIGEVALIGSVAPLFVVAYNLIRRIPVRTNEYAGAGLSLLGVAVIILPNAVWMAGEGYARILGDVLALSTAGTAAFTAILLRSLQERTYGSHGTTVSILTFAIGGFLLLLLSYLLDTGMALYTLSSSRWVVLIALGIFSTLVPTASYTVASSRLPPVLTTTIRLLTPVFAAIFAAVLLGEFPSLWVIPGGLLVLAGIIWMIRA